ncbi:DUF2750 domain-containing protein [Geomesophilobacter sediminis]|uniref:DUF2750 domain-containing protein n=1 Tax=Geomesophilobacter sediminis TaxID=2798584 RepID=A0A8J7LU70_9BACT|nr:DUF2750 domain-containing protein [Geomesophilobacter sediminis]MBJ6723445.1 DUF2750 domain-containing protein [Geomesophilobacter sediminis]
MNIDFIGQIIFSQEVQANRQVWVVKGRNENIYAMELDQAGFSLPVWSAKERAVEFLKNTQLLDGELEPHPIGLDLFINIYLSDKMLGINELLINMDGNSAQALVLSLDEFLDAHDIRKAG